MHEYQHICSARTACDGTQVMYGGIELEHNNVIRKKYDIR